MTIFRYDDNLLKKFPLTTGGVILAEGVTNGPTSPALAEAYRTEQAATLQRIGNTPLSQLPSLAAWRSIFSGFGVEPTKYRSAAEALLRRLTKKGDIPGINTLVDLGNLVSIRYALPVAVFDTQAVEGIVTVHLAAGDERFTPMGEAVIENPEPGEVVFSDEAGMVLARRWCWRQSEQSAAQIPTRRVIVTVETQHPGSEAQVEAALEDLQTLLREYAGGSLSAALLNKDQPEF